MLKRVSYLVSINYKPIKLMSKFNPTNFNV